MKKIFSQKNILIFAALLLIVVLHYLSILKPIENSIRFILRPVQKIFYTTASFIGDQVSILTIRKNLAQENDSLRQQVIDLWQKNSQLQALSKENDILKLELECVKDNSETKFITAQIIGRSPSQNPAVVTINAGLSQGILDGLPAIANNGVIVGRITATYHNTSQVTLLPNNNSRVAASFTGLNNSNGLVIGEHNLSIRMILIPADIVVEKGSLVVTSGIEENIPAGFLIGRVQEVDRLPNDLFQSATLEPIIDYDELKYIIIPLPANQ